MDNYIKAFQNFNLLGDLEKCKDDGKLFLDFALSVLNISPLNCKLMCSQDEFNCIASKFKKWPSQTKNEETKETGISLNDADIKNTYADATDDEYLLWKALPKGNRTGRSAVKENLLPIVKF